MLDNKAAKKSFYYSDQMGAHDSSLHTVRNWYEKAAFEILSGISFSNFSDTFEQVLCDTKALNETVP